MTANLYIMNPLLICLRGNSRGKVTLKTKTLIDKRPTEFELLLKILLLLVFLLLQSLEKGARVVLLLGGL